MKILRAKASDGRVFRAVDDRYHVTPAANALQAGTLGDEITLPRGLGPIVRPQAAYRWLLPQLAAITPQYIETILRGAMAGSHVQQLELFDLMLDTWPELSACAQELTYGVLAGRKLIFEPFAEEGEQPTPNALERCRLVSSALRRMRPDPAADENDLEGTLLDLLDGWFRGVTALEVAWQTNTTARHGTIIAPRSTSWVHPTCFAFDPNGRLALRLEPPNTAAAVAAPSFHHSRFTQHGPPLTPFPPHKFLLGIYKAKSGSALGGALLRPLAWWWCAANFSADWLLNLAQVFGLPFRWANYDPSAPEETVSRVCSMLQQMGSSGWAAFPAGTSMQLLDGGGRGSDHSPQGELLDRADRYARLLVLGQTMSGSQDASKGGGKAFGEVESDVKSQRLEAAGRYACRVLNTQLIPSILELNYGDTEEAPTARLLSETEGDLTAAHRDQALAAAGVRIPVSYLRKKYSIPTPTEEEETIGGASERPGASGHDPVDAAGMAKPPLSDDAQDDNDPALAGRSTLHFPGRSIQAGESDGHPYRGNQYSTGQTGGGRSSVDRPSSGSKSGVSKGPPRPGGTTNTPDSGPDAYVTPGDTPRTSQLPKSATPADRASQTRRRMFPEDDEAPESRRRNLPPEPQKETRFAFKEGELKFQTAGKDPMAGSFDHLRAARARGKIPATVWRREDKLARDGEHFVEYRRGEGRVYKHTAGHFFGYRRRLSSKGRFKQTYSTASQYLRRQHEHNIVFGTDFRFEGAHAEGMGGLTFSQTFFPGEILPSQSADALIRSYMIKHGFEKVSGNISNTWFHRKTGHIAVDVRPANFRSIIPEHMNLDPIETHRFKAEQLRLEHLRPVDIMLQKVRRNSPIHRFMKAATRA